MLEPAGLLMLPFLDWVSSRPRSYAEAMDAWRTSCPRQSVWEDALIEGFIAVNAGAPTGQGEVTLTPHGRAVLDGSRVQTSKVVAAESSAACNHGVE